MKPIHRFKSPLSLAIAILLVGASSSVFAGNTVTGSGAVVAGGDQNTASGGYATVGGGLQNSATNGFDVVSGGTANGATGGNSTVPGGSDNTAAADHSFAAGEGAYVRPGDKGTFIWADTTGEFEVGGEWTPPIALQSSGVNQFIVRANGGFGINTTPVNANVALTVAATAGNPGYSSIFLRQSNAGSGILISSGDATTGSKANNASFYVDQYNVVGHTRRLSLDGSGNLIVTAQAYKPGGGAWAASSDARLKTNIQPLEHALDRLLALRGVTFEYAHPDNGIHPSGVFTGFIAQEVEPNFPNWIGHDSDGYMTVGPQGFEALTVEALRTMKQDNDTRVSKLETANAELQQQIAELRRQLAALARR